MTDTIANTVSKASKGTKKDEIPTPAATNAVALVNKPKNNYKFPPIPQGEYDFDPNDTTGVADAMLQNKNYWRHIDTTKMSMKYSESESAHMLFNCDAEIPPPAGGKPNPRGNPVFIVLPPFRIAYPNLHATGNYPNDKDSTPENAKFSVTFVEGNIPESLLKKFPALEREQKLAMDALSKLDNWITDEFYSKDEIGGVERKKTEETTERLLVAAGQKKGTESFKNGMASALTDLKKAFDEKNNKLVRIGKDGVVRQLTAKKAVSVKQGLNKTQSNKKKKYAPTGDPNHYIDYLLADGRDYSPPSIKDGNGREINTGKYNDKQILYGGDICVGTIMPKPYVGTAQNDKRGGRWVLVGLQVVRQAPVEEREMVGGGLGDLADDFVAPPEEEEDSPAPVNPKKRKSTDQDAAQPTKTSKTDKPGDASGSEDDKPVATPKKKPSDQDVAQLPKKPKTHVQDHDEEDQSPPKTKPKPTTDTKGKPAQDAKPAPDAPKKGDPKKAKKKAQKEDSDDEGYMFDD